MKAIIAALLAALATTQALAASPTIPAEYRGEWCTDGHPYFLRRAYMSRVGWENVTCIKITAKKDIREDGECEIVSIAPAQFSGHDIKFNCNEGGGGPGVTRNFATTWGSGPTEARRRANGKRLYIEEVEK